MTSWSQKPSNIKMLNNRRTGKKYFNMVIKNSSKP